MTGSYAYTGIGSGVDHDAARDYIRDGYLFAPRTVLKGRTKLLRSQLPSISVDLKNLPLTAQQTLEANLGDVAGHRRAVMFSGGFDSMLIACLAKRCGARVTAVTVQFDEFNPVTVAGAVEAAVKAGIDHLVLNVKAVEFLAAFEEIAELTDEPVLDLDLCVVYAALKKYDPAVAGETFISGMGSDQWFGNMALEQIPGGAEARRDWAIVDEQAHHQVAQAHGFRFIFPFLSKDMLGLSTSVPDQLKKDKALLRQMAIANSIPHRGVRSEVQVPGLMRHVLIKTYGHRAWPSPVSVEQRNSLASDQALRQIVLGLWLEKTIKKAEV